MKIVQILLAWCLIAGFSFDVRGASHGGAVHVRGYTTKSGTYVAPHYRSAPDGNFNNNWSTKGNVNLYTGREGTRVTPPSRGGVPGISGGQVELVPRVSNPLPATVAVPPTSNPSDRLVRPEVQSPVTTEHQKTENPSGWLTVTITNEDPILDYQKRDAAKGFPEAQYALGIRYLTGNGVPKDQAKGEELVNRAYKNGSLRAREKIWEMRRTMPK